MNLENLSLLKGLVPDSYIKQSSDNLISRNKKIKLLLEKKKIPDIGWDDLTIETFLNQLSAMDSNNFVSSSGVGEREGRIASDLVARRHFRLCHGIGRSGNLYEPQPKASGSSIMYQLTNILSKDLLKLMGIEVPIYLALVPVATGMSIVLSLITLRKFRPDAKYVIWSRIDQKSCFKSIIAAGYEPLILDTVKNGNFLSTNLEEIKKMIEKFGAKNIACIITTTSCFAPRNCDDIELVATICKNNNIPHLINNAYGLQSRYIMKRIQRAQRKGRVDIFVQSTDKNLMVPVGGAIVAAFEPELMSNFSSTYPGRASSSPVIDTFITLLSLGKTGYLQLVDSRVEMFNYFYLELKKIVEPIFEEVIKSEENPISMIITLKNIPKENITKLGSMLFTRNITGARVVPTMKDEVVDRYSFPCWGSHNSSGYNDYPYLTVAAAIGIAKGDVDAFTLKFSSAYEKLKQEIIA